MTDKTQNTPDENEKAAENIQPETVENEAAETEAPAEEHSETDRLNATIDELKAQLDKEKNDYLYLRADFDNYRKRTLREREELIRNAAERVLLGILPIVDDFERGLQAAANATDAEAVRQGMELIYNKLMRYLSDNGVKPIESTGAVFDPDLHEAIAAIPAPTAELKGKVIDTTTRGYMLNDKVLRHAKVAVGE